MFVPMPCDEEDDSVGPVVRGFVIGVFGLVSLFFAYLFVNAVFYDCVMWCRKCEREQARRNAAAVHADPRRQRSPHPTPTREDFLPEVV